MSNPHFIIAGERRSGSTTLYEILKQHPEVGMFHKSDFDFFIESELFSKTPVKEENIKNWSETHPISKYQNLFNDLVGKIGQKDADLLWWKPSHKRLELHLPETKFIFILRDPIKRAESQYFNELSKGRETLSFKKALLREEKDDLSDWQKLHLQYKARGCYAESLKHFYKFIPKHRVKVIILEELILCWENVMTDLCNFLEIDSKIGLTLDKIHSNKEESLVRKRITNRRIIKWFFDLWDRLSEAVIVRITKDKDKRFKLRKRYRGFYHTSKRANEQMDQDLLERLTDYYKPYNRDLEHLLGYKINYW